MNELFVELHRSVLSAGLIDAILRLSQGNGPYSQSFKDWHQGIVQGKSLVESLMNSSFREDLKEVLFIGITSSCLDYVLDDLIRGTTFKEVVDKYGSNQARVVCMQCLEGEIEMIRKRADIEGAMQLHLSMSSDYLMEQQYIGKNSVRISVNCGEMMFSSLRDFFSNNENIELSDNRTIKVFVK